MMTREQAASQLAQVCASDEEFLHNWPRAGSASVIAEALTVLTGQKFQVTQKRPGFIGNAFDIEEVKPAPPPPEYTFVLMPLAAKTIPQYWRAFAIPQESVGEFAKKTECVETITLMFAAADETAAKAYVRGQYPNAKFFGESP